MSESRFEKYVRETVMDGVREKRDALVADVKSAEAEVESVFSELVAIINRHLSKAGLEIEKHIAKIGWRLVDGYQGKMLDDVVSVDSWKNKLDDRIQELVRTYEYCKGYIYGKDHPVRIAKEALEKFDERINKGVRRLVVMKVDLKMKTDEFDKALNDKVKEILA